MSVFLLHKGETMSRPQAELTERRGAFSAAYLGTQVKQGEEFFVFAVEGMLERDEKDHQFTVWIPNNDEHGGSSIFDFQRAVGRRRHRSKLDPRPKATIQVLDAAPESLPGITPLLPPKERVTDSHPRDVRLIMDDLHVRYRLNGRLYERKLSLRLPFVARSRFLTGAVYSLLIVTAPLDWVLLPLELAAIAMAASSGT